jgi:hypothetical protein
MIPVVRFDLDPERYRHWHESYQERGEAILHRVAGTVFDAMQAHGMDRERTLRALRKTRATLDDRFCLLLYASGGDEALLRGNAGLVPELADETVLREALEVSRNPQRNAEVMSALMYALDIGCGTHLLMLERADETAPEGPIRVRAPDEIWFDSFRCLAELAQAVLVVGNVSGPLLDELWHLCDVGLRPRVLVWFDGALVWWGGRRLALERRRQWRGVEGYVEAVAFAAARRPARPRASR